MSKFALRALLANWQEATPEERKALERKVPGAFGKLQPVLKQLATELEAQVRRRTERERRSNPLSKKSSLSSRSGASTAARSAPVSPHKHPPSRKSKSPQATPTKPKRQARTPEPLVPLNTPRAQQQSTEHFEPWSRPPSPILPPSDLPTLEAYTGRWLETGDDSLIVSSLYEHEPLRHQRDRDDDDDDDDDNASPEAQAISIISELVRLRQQIDAAATRLAEVKLLQHSAFEAALGSTDSSKQAAPSERVSACTAHLQAALRDLEVAKECSGVAETAAHRLFSTLLAVAPSSPATDTESSCGPSDCSLSDDLEVSYNACDLQLLVIQGTPYQPSRPVTPPHTALRGEDYSLADSSLYYSSSRWSC